MNPWRGVLARLDIAPVRPPWWARGGHAQTLLGHILPAQPAPDPENHLFLEAPDGDRLSVFYHRGERPVVLLLFHGLGGHGDSDYMQQAARVGLAHGLHVYRVEHRGCGTGRGHARGPYHSGRAEDLSLAVDHARQRHPGAFVLAIGFSLSGNALLLLGAGFRGEHPPDLAISVNPPIRLEDAVLRLKRGFNRIYDLRFARRCTREVTERHRDGLRKQPFSLPLTATLHDFDAAYTAPAAGFASREDYYQTCSAARFIPEIKVPTVILTARDDPMVDYRYFTEIEMPEHVHLHLEAHGGHMGYLTRGDGWGAERWLDHAIDSYLTVALEAMTGHTPLSGIT